MSSQIPPSWFKSQEPNSSDPNSVRRRERLLQQLPALIKERGERGRAQKFEPYLLIRSVLGDRGDRPINVPFWESPDIWTAPEAPDNSPAVPASHGGTAVVGQKNTVYAHVWNLGFAPLAGVRIEFYWFNPSLVIDGTNANLIGTAVCELAGRGMAGSHKLVKCSKPWTPVMANGGHECLLARVSGLGDPVGGNEWSPWLNRHVAQRNVSVIPAGTSENSLISSLNASRGIGNHLQLVQVGAAQGKLAVQLVAPQLSIPKDIHTQLLSELNAVGDIALSKLANASAAMLAPVHEMAHGVEHPHPTLHLSGQIAVVDPTRLFGKDHLRNHSSHQSKPVANLLNSVAALQGGGRLLGPPSSGEAIVLRIAAYSGTQLVGGHTLVVT